jgi:soluble lytic murein transglycosylase-like protein
MNKVFTVWKANSAKSYSKHMLVGLFCLLILATTLVMQRQNTPQAPASLQKIVSPSAAIIAAPFISQKNVSLYKQAFSATKAGAHAQASHALAEIDNTLLLGHVLAARYLHPQYATTPQELAVWLENFSDHPQTASIIKLAKRKGVATHLIKSTRFTANNESTKRFKGRGYIDHLGAKGLPNLWYHGLSSWKKGHYKTASSHFERAAKQKNLSAWHQATAYYWAARAYKRLDRYAMAKTMLEKAAKHPLTLYGMLATRALKQPLMLSAASPYISAELEEAPAYLRAKALIMIGQHQAAEGELRHLITQLPHYRHAEVLAMAGKLGLANLQIRLGKMQDLHDDERIFARYPTPDFVMRAANSINPALALAIARQESAFYSQAKSAVGAQGIMQIMPQTARHVMTHPKLASLNEDIIAEFGRFDLNEPSTSVKIGASYIQILMQYPYIRSSLIHVLAAYNAGPGNLASWSRAAKNVHDPLLYIESIPFSETRNYVVQVLAHYAVYQTLTGQETSAINALEKGSFPLYQG